MLLSLPIERIMSPPMIYLKVLRRLHTHACKIRWKIEEFHREIKQLTGIESCQCRKARLQKNHIACAMLVWIRLKHLAVTIQVKLFTK